MKNKQNVIIVITSLVLLLSITGCVKHSYIDISTHIDVEYKNKKDSNLLNNHSKILLYYNINGKKIKAEDVMSQTSDHNKGYDVIGDSIKYIRIFNDYKDIKVDFFINYIQLDNYAIDTIKSELKNKKGSYFIDRVWINGRLMTKSYYNSINNVLTIIK